MKGAIVMSGSFPAPVGNGHYSRRSLLKHASVLGALPWIVHQETGLANGFDSPLPGPRVTRKILSTVPIPAEEMPSALPGLAVWHVTFDPGASVHWADSDTRCRWIDVVHLRSGAFRCWFSGRSTVYPVLGRSFEVSPGSESDLFSGDSLLDLDGDLAAWRVNASETPSAEFTISLYATVPQIAQLIDFDPGIHIIPCGGLLPTEWNLLPASPIDVQFRELRMDPGSALLLNEDPPIFRFVESGPVERICLDARGELLESTIYETGHSIAHRYLIPEGKHMLTNSSDHPAALLEVTCGQSKIRSN